LTVIGQTLFFTANDGVNGAELWKSDGTEAGTVLVKDIVPGPDSSNVTEIVNVNGTAFFRASHPDTGPELWKSDGTEAGTVLVKDITPGPAGSSPSGLISVGGTLFFAAFRSGIGTELWQSDGTEGGTVLVKNAPPDSAPLIAVNGVLFFRAGNGLWRTDGTESGTALIRDGILPSPSGQFACGGGFGTVNGTLVFTGRDASGCELWTSDGLTADLLMDVNPGPASSLGSFAQAFGAATGLVLFSAYDDAHGLELWATDGASATRLVRDIAPGAAWSSLGFFTPVGPLVFFTANDTVTGTELWAISRSALGRELGLPETTSDLTARGRPAP
jgi:ELWxxDGT repeat protein